MKKKICVVITNRANFARVKSLILEIKKSKKLDLLLVISGSALSHRFGQIEKELKNSKLNKYIKAYFLVDGGNLIAQAKSTSLAISEFSKIFLDLQPDLVITVGDRYETMATAIASTYMNIPLAHLQGGEVSGNLDEMVRHSVTKLASYHFTTTKKSKERVIKLGEEKKRVFFSGCPGMDLINLNKKKNLTNFFDKVPYTGKKFLFDKEYILVVNHSVSSETGNLNLKHVNLLFNALKKIKLHKIVFWPNADSYSNIISSRMRNFKENDKNNNFTYVINTSPEEYIDLISNAGCLVGNSSSFIREGSQLGLPAVILGSRQDKREIGKNVIYSNYNETSILKKVDYQLKKGKYKKQKIYGNGKAGNYIIKILEKLNFTVKKQITY